MKSKLLIVLSVFTVAVSGDKSSNEISRRDSKLFPFLAVVSFPNSKCTDLLLGDGLCYTSSQCTRNGGVPSPTPCAQNYGVCCIFQQSCSGTPPTLTVRNNITQLVGQANTMTQPCQIKIPRQPGVCQLRLDFKTFNVGTADVEANCPNDFVSFKSDNLPDGLTICGINTGQHLYLHYGQLDTININTNLVTAGSSYNIEVTMIKCDSTERAPDGCTQYYTAPTAEVTSFNFPIQQLNSELYTVCVKSTVGQTIQWSPCPLNNTFSISGVTHNPPTPTSAMSGDQCKTDFIYIPPGNKICGASLNSTFDSKLQPFYMVVNFDTAEVPIPDGLLDPTTGCPPGWLCETPVPGPCPTDPNSMDCCIVGGTCTPPIWYFTMGLIDAGNLGFCLRYSITA